MTKQYTTVRNVELGFVDAAAAERQHLLASLCCVQLVASARCAWQHVLGLFGNLPTSFN